MAGIRRMVAVAIVFLAITIVSSGAGAQTYPARPIRVVVPFVPGGGSDTLARVVVQKLTEGLKQQAFVDNRGGAGGRLGTELVARAAPDGYTLLLVGSGALVIAPALYQKLAYDVQRDFAPITLVASSALVLMVHPSVPARSMKQLIALCGSRPGALNYASSGVGAPGHLSAELFQSMARVRLTHITYKGTAPAILSVIAGETDLTFSTMPPAVPAIQSGRLRGIAVTSSVRSSILPDLPTLSESGLPGYETITHYGLLAPAGAPREAVTRLNATMVKAFQGAETRKRLETDGMEGATSTPEAFAAVLKSETAKWARVIRAAGIKPE